MISNVININNKLLKLFIIFIGYALIIIVIINIMLVTSVNVYLRLNEILF